MEVMTSPTYSDVSSTSTVQALKLIWLVVQPYPSEKYESELGLSFLIYGKKMFQTTNQFYGFF